MLQAQSRQENPLLQRLPSRNQLAPTRVPQRVNQPPQGRSLKRQQGKARHCQSRPRTNQQGSRASSWEAQSRCSHLSAPARSFSRESRSRQLSSGSVHHMRLYTAILSKSTLCLQVLELIGKHGSTRVAHPTQSASMAAGCPAVAALLQKPRWPGRSPNRIQSRKKLMLRQRLLHVQAVRFEDGCAGAGADQQRWQHQDRRYHAQARALAAGRPAAPAFHACQCHSSALQGEPLGTTSFWLPCMLLPAQVR